MPRLIILVGGLAAVLVLLLILMASLGHGAKNINPGPNYNIPVSSLVPSSSGPALDSSPSAVTDAQSFTVSSTSPQNNATNVSLNSPITFTFNRNFDTKTAGVTFSPDTQFDFSSDSNSVTVVPNPGFAPGMQYQVTISVPDQNYSYTLNFATVAPNPTNTPQPSDTPTATPESSPTPTSSPTQ